jgi:hypothetical protein
LAISEKGENKNYFSIINHFWLKKGRFLPYSEGVCKGNTSQSPPDGFALCDIV